MNIVFLNAFEVLPTKGGTERITYSLAKYLTNRYGFRCLSLYFVSDINKYIDEGDNVFANTQQAPDNLTSKWLADYLIHNKVDVIINQVGFYYIQLIRDAIGKGNCKYVQCYHFAPGWQNERLCLLWSQIKQTQNIHSKLRLFAKILIFPILKKINTIKLQKSYKKGYELSDATVLLSNRFNKDFVAHSGISDSYKLFAINNMLSFETYISEKKILEKKKVVLVVSRLEEGQKRLTHALNIWKEVKKESVSAGWTFKIVGHGIDEDNYKKKVKQENIPDVEFLGRKQPQFFYEQSSIFLMTSRSEGWGLTLTEAMQYGCVPLAYDSYASVHDIINDGDNGFIITDSNINAYVDKVLYLMKHEKIRQEIAKRAVSSVHKFDVSIIGEKWKQLLTELVTKK